jgi:hypothetical protein
LIACDFPFLAGFEYFLVQCGVFKHPCLVARSNVHAAVLPRGLGDSVPVSNRPTHLKACASIYLAAYLQHSTGYWKGLTVDQWLFLPRSPARWMLCIQNAISSTFFLRGPYDTEYILGPNSMMAYPQSRYMPAARGPLISTHLRSRHIAHHGR